MTTADVTAATITVSIAVNAAANTVKNLIQRERLCKGCSTSAEILFGTFEGFVCLFVCLFVFPQKTIRELIWHFGSCISASFQMVCAKTPWKFALITQILSCSQSCLGKKEMHQCVCGDKDLLLA